MSRPALLGSFALALFVVVAGGLVYLAETAEPQTSVKEETLPDDRFPK
ncbi:MAG TPA: hypothetical protein PL096_00745 [Micropepsaceae bacterium]|nr:hypothetical protein [Micropepsaceae bacterium]